GVQSRHHVVAVGAELLGVDGDDEVLVGAAWPLGHVLPAYARDFPQALSVPLGDPGPSLYPVFQMPEGDEHQRGVQFGEAGVEPGEPGVVVAGVAVVAGEAVDFDGDLLPDIYVAEDRYGDAGGVLLHNDGGFVFRDVTVGSGLEGGFSLGATPPDLDRDG